MRFDQWLHKTLKDKVAPIESHRVYNEYDMVRCWHAAQAAQREADAEKLKDTAKTLRMRAEVMEDQEDRRLAEHEADSLDYASKYVLKNNTPPAAIREGGKGE